MRRATQRRRLGAPPLCVDGSGQRKFCWIQLAFRRLFAYGVFRVGVVQAESAFRPASRRTQQKLGLRRSQNDRRSPKTNRRSDTRR